LEIAGHFVHFDNGAYKERGDYWSKAADIERTAKRLADSIKSDEGGFKHLLVFAHGGLNAPKASARRIAAMKDGFMRNDIYPFHIMYDTGLVKETTDAILRALKLSEDRSKGIFGWIAEKASDISDKLIEDGVRRPVTAIWDEMKSDASWPFEPKRANVVGDGMHTIKTFAEALKDTPIQIHLAGHSTGAVLLGHMLQALDALENDKIVKSCNLMAPACTVDFYKEYYAPRLGRRRRNAPVVRIPSLNIYNLNEELELDDNVVLAYRKSLLYLVSRALEKERDKPILGMQKYSKEITGPNFFYSGNKNSITKSTSHGGFDNDPDTLNHMMKNILGKAPKKPFTSDEMKGY
jgi:hypothetical protein